MTLSLEQKKRRNIMFATLISIKRLFGCMKCGKREDGLPFEFHHTNCKTKKASVHDLIHRGYGPDAVQREIMKCTILCRECHKEVHNVS